MEHREAEVARDPNTGRVTGYVEHVEKRRSGFGNWLFGLILGALLVAGGVALYAAKQGGYQNAGAQTDQALSDAQGESSSASRQLAAGEREAADDLGDAAQQAGRDISRAAN